MSTSPLSIVYFGTYDLGKPRNRMMIAALRDLGHDVVEIHSPVWQGIEDKSQVSGLAGKARIALRWLGAYPGLLRRWQSHLRENGPPDLVFVGYLGHLDVLVLRRAARGIPLVWDAFLSIYDTVVRDRKMVGPGNPLARLLFAWERAACRAADKIVLDTRAHGEMFTDLYGFDPAKLGVVPVGAETAAFPRQPPRPAPGPGNRPKVLFYGQFIPLHGISTIVEAARRSPDIDWTLIGTGQDAPGIAEDLKTDPIAHLTWIDWVEYEDLVDHIAGADICLGIFGTSEKAGRVIPNKVYQILASGRPLVTRDGPAARDFFGGDVPGVRLVPPGDPAALNAALQSLIEAADTPTRDLLDGFDGNAQSAHLDRIVADLSTPQAEPKRPVTARSGR